MTIQDRVRTTRLSPNHNLSTGIQPLVQMRISDTASEPAWDAFVARTPGGHHVQTSLWSQVKASIGWRVVRLVLTQGEKIVGGAQVLMRPLPLFGTIGYVPKGPLLACNDPWLLETVLHGLQQIAHTQHIRYLALQPPNHGEVCALQLTDAGFRPTSLDALPTATTLLDLSQDQDALLASMRAKTRQYIRLSQRSGVTVREGTEAELHDYYRLVAATGQRKNFSVFPEDYFSAMWHTLRPHGYIKLFLAEFKGEIVSAQIAIPFGDTIINKLSVWSGQHASRHPNEALMWEAIVWAKAHGYRYYDFEGIDQTAARSILAQQDLPASLKQTVTWFKLGFGGEVKRYPGVYGYIPNALLRSIYTTIFAKLPNSPIVYAALHNLRTL